MNSPLADLGGGGEGGLAGGERWGNTDEAFYSVC